MSEWLDERYIKRKERLGVGEDGLRKGWEVREGS